MHIHMGDKLKENLVALLCYLGHFADMLCSTCPWLCFLLRNVFLYLLCYM